MSDRHNEEAPMTSPELREALERADRLIDWMAGYIGKMAPGKYGSCYSDLNEHGCFMSKLRAESAAS